MSDWFVVIEWIVFLAGAVGVGLVIWYVVSIQFPVHGMVAFGSDKDGLRNAAPVIALARRFVSVKGGELNSQFWSNPIILQSARQAVDNGAAFRVLFGPKLDVMNKDFFRLILQSEYKDKFEFRRLPKRSMPHFMSIDDRFISWETRHEPLQPRRGAIGRDDRSAVRFRNRFDIEWTRAEPFDLVATLEQIRNNVNLPVPGTEDTADSESFGFITRDDGGNVVLCDQASLESLSQELQNITVAA